MLAITGNITLYENVPLNHDQDNVWLSNGGGPSAAPNRTLFENWLSSGGYFQLLNVRYTEDVLTVNKPYTNCYSFNYCKVQNATSQNTISYYFLDNPIAISENSTTFQMRLDVFSTYIYYATFEPSYIERNTVYNDNPAYNLVGEGIGVDDMPAMETVNIASPDLTQLSVVIACSKDMYSDNLVTTGGAVYSGIYNSALLFRFNLTETTKIRTFFEQCDKAGVGDAIIACYVVPTAFTGTDVLVSEGPVVTYNGHLSFNQSLLFGGYVPECKKMYTYEFARVVIHNQVDTIEYMPEYFTQSPWTYGVDYLLAGNVVNDPTVYFVPKNYMGIPDNYDEKAVLSGYPQLAWFSDVYANWIAQNKTQQNLGVVEKGFGILMNLFTGNVMGAIGGGFDIANQFASNESKKKLPARNSGSSNSTLDVSMGIHKFVARSHSVNNVTARRLDFYLKLYGYKINSFLTPFLYKRTYFDYIKAHELNVSFSVHISRDHEVEFKGIFAKGVRIWHGTFMSTSYVNGFNASVPAYVSGDILQ
jgi:hypothetical protein